MEKYSQYRDKGSGIAPFFPISPQPAGVYLPVYIFLFAIRVPLLAVLSVAYFGFLQWLPIGGLVRKAALWLILGVPGIWWVDLQIDGVKRGTLSSHAPNLPRPGTIIAASSTSPLDPLYLAAIFDPIIATTYPNTRLVRPITLIRAILHQLSPRSLYLTPPSGANGSLMTLSQLRDAHPNRIILVMAESTTTNGRGILPLSPALLATPTRTPIFPINLRYGPPDITTPIPGWYAGLTFLWNLCSRPSHTIRVRIAAPVANTAASDMTRSSNNASQNGRSTAIKNSYATNFMDSLDLGDSVSSSASSADFSGNVSSYNSEEQQLLDKVGEALARLGRVKRVGLSVSEKADFVTAWTRRKR